MPHFVHPRGRPHEHRVSVKQHFNSGFCNGHDRRIGEFNTYTTALHSRVLS